MKYTKFQRRLALGGAVLLVLLYLATLIFAFTDNPLTPNLLGASIFLTVVIPISLYAFILITKITKKK